MTSQWILRASPAALGILVLYSVMKHASCMANSKRTQEKLFANSTLLHGRNVTCENVRSDDVGFPAETWTCYNMRVDGLRIRYWYIHGFGSKENDEHSCSDGREKYDTRNDLPALCREMLKIHGYHKDLWTTYVNDGSCSHSGDPRAIFVVKEGAYQWETYSPGKGYVKTMRCMGVE